MIPVPGMTELPPGGSGVLNLRKRHLSGSDSSGTCGSFSENLPRIGVELICLQIAIFLLHQTQMS